MMKCMTESRLALKTVQRITCAETAQPLNMSAKAYDRYKKGERTPSSQTISFMTQFFNTSADYLYGLSDDASPQV